jgi:hypothetical protein
VLAGANSKAADEEHRVHHEAVIGSSVDEAVMDFHSERMADSLGIPEASEDI